MRRRVRISLVLLLFLSAMVSRFPAQPALAAEQPSADEPIADQPAPDPSDPVKRRCFNFDLSAGTSTPFVTDAFGTADPDWQVISGPGVPGPGPAYSIDPHPSWFTTAGANWVDPFNSGYLPGGAGGYDPVGDYVFRTSFTLNGALYTNFMLEIATYAGDNRVELFLDGSPTPLGPAVSFVTPGGPISVPIGPGSHVLEARVHNMSGWMGLLVHARVTGDCLPDLAISKKAEGPFTAGLNGTYYLVVSNVGPGVAPGPITVTDYLPPGSVFVAAGGTGWTCSASSGVVTCTHPGPLGPSTSLPPIALTILVPPGHDQITNCATVEGKGDRNPDNNKTCVDTPVDPGKPGAICGVKFEDLNGNGVQDPGEQGLPGWTIELRDQGGNLITTVVTGAGGRYCFKQIMPGYYSLNEILKPNWVQTAPGGNGVHNLTLYSAQMIPSVDFGNRREKDDPCCLTFRFTGGRADKFDTSDGPEPASPSPGYQAFMQANNFSPVGFDHPEMNHQFGHTIVLPEGNCIKRARLTVRVKPLGGPGSLSANDSLALRFIGSNGLPVPGAPVWAAYFGSGNPGTALLPNQWHTGNYGPETIQLDLSSLPGGGNLLPTLHSLRYLDIQVQDDTSVDYVRLTVEFCECEQGAGNADPKH